MTDVVLFSQAEISRPEDFQAIGAAARSGDDAIIAGAIGYPRHWADFVVSEQAETLLRVSAGILFRDDRHFRADEHIDVPVTSFLPPVLGDTKWCAVLVRGLAETESENRQVLINAATGATTPQSLPKFDRRRIDIVIQQGVPGPTPIRPTVASSECNLAWVLLSNNGIELIEMNTADRAVSLYEVEGRLRVLEGAFLDISRRTATLETNLANVQAEARNQVSPILFRQVQRQVAATRRLLDLPDTAFGALYDPGLVPDVYDRTHADWLARIFEGVRFPYAGVRDERLELYDEVNSGLAIHDPSRLSIPAFTEVERIVVDATSSLSRNISQQVHTVTTAVRREVARSSTRFGPTITVCENTSEWSGISDRRAGETFNVGGETFQNLGVTANPWNQTETAQNGHREFAAAQIIVDTWTEVYWDYITENIGLNGSVVGNTFLNVDPMVITSIDLNFTRVGSTGDVHLLLCECGETGAPDFNRVLASCIKPVGQIQTGWVRFPLRPSYAPPGKRLAWFTITTGNHAIKVVAGNTYAQGSAFLCTDGIWSQVNTEEDHAFRVNAARFAKTRTVVEFEALELDSGMTELRLLYPGWQPAGTSLVWEIRPIGDTEWYPLKAYEANPLVGLPPQVALRAVFLGTTDLQPAIVLDSKARGVTGRHGSTMRAVSDVHDFGASTSTVRTQTVVDAYDAAIHTATPTIIVGTTVIAASTVSIEADPTKPSRRTIYATFNLGSATSSARYRFTMTTTNIVSVPFIQNWSMHAG
jgi:hypothetical protein